MTNGMSEDWSWTKSAKQYVDLYETTIARAQGPSTNKDSGGKDATGKDGRQLAV